MYFKLMKSDDNSVKGSAAIMNVGESLVFIEALRIFAEDETVHEDDRKTATSMIAEIKKEQTEREER